jgi:serine/threonine protein kinase
MMHGLQPGDPQLIGPYRLKGRLGAGGMGRVYLGLSPGGRAVAVKVIRADLAQDPEFRARFRREIAVARKVSSLYTAQVIDADVEGEVPWLATAYVAGPSLADVVRDHGPLPAGSVLELAAGLAEALSAIHATGVVHRDLKPANVLLAEDGPRVIDFGISQVAEASALTHTGLVVGSPGFMSPEQAEGREVGPPSDVFSLGAVLAFAATGLGPFGTGSTPALVYRVVHSAPQLEQVPAEVRPLVERCLAKDPARRPTAGDLLAGAAYPATGWLPEPVTRAFSVDTAAVTFAPATPGALATTGAPTTTSASATTGAPAITGAPPTVTGAGQARLAPPDLPPWGSPAVSPAPGPGQPSARPGQRHRRGGKRSLAAAAVLAGVIGAGVTAGFTMTAGSAPTHADQSVRRDVPVQTIAPPAAPASSASSSPAYVPRTTPPPTAPAYMPPASTAPPATTAPPPTSAAPSPGAFSPSLSASSPPPSPTPTPSTSSPSGGGY